MNVPSKKAIKTWLLFLVGLCLSLLLAACGGGGTGPNPDPVKTVYLNERVQLVFPESSGATSLTLNGNPVSNASFTSSSVYFDVTLANLGGTFTQDATAVVTIGSEEVLKQPLKIVESALKAGNELAVYTQNYSESEFRAALAGLSSDFKIKDGTFRVNDANSGTAVVTFGQQSTDEANKLLNSVQDAGGKSLASSPNLLYGISGRRAVYWSSPRCDVLDALDEYVAEGNWKALKKAELFSLLGITAAQARSYVGNNTVTPIVDTGNGDFDQFDCVDAGNVKEGHGKYIYDLVSSAATGVTFNSESVCDSSGFCSTEQIINYLREIERELLTSPNQKVIVNLSISGSKGLNDTIDQAIYDRLKYYETEYPNQFLAVAAAGNYGISEDAAIASSPAYPASYSDAVDKTNGLGNIISVGAVGRTGANTWKVSETNPKNVPVDILAPGIKLCIETNGGKCAPYGDDVGITGSSFSTAIVTGVAAMMWDACPTLTAKQIKTLMQTNGVAVEGSSYKMVNADPKFAEACGGGPTTIDYSQVASKWTGNVFQSNTNETFTVNIELGSSAKVGEQIGTIDTPEYQCGGILLARPKEGNTYVFLKQLQYENGTRDCVDQTIIKLTPNSNNTEVTYKSFLLSGEETTVNGVLTKGSSFNGCTTVTNYTIGTEVSGELNASDCTFEQTGTFVDYYDFGIDSTETVTFSTNNGGLYFYERNGNYIGGGSFVQRQARALPAGDYVVAVVNSGAIRYELTLTTTKVGFNGCAVLNPYTIGTNVTGSLNADDCFGDSIGEFVDYYVFTIDQTRAVTFSTTNGGLYFYERNGAYIGGGSFIQNQTRNLVAGTYVVAVFNNGEINSYSLQVTIE